MTARFGRNKRRRAREALAAANEELISTSKVLQATDNLLRYRSIEVEELNEIIYDAKLMAGRLSALFPATELKTETDRLDMARDGRWWVEILARIGGAPTTAEDSMLERQTLDMIPLDVLIDSVDRSQLDRRVHAMLRYKDRSVAYALSEETEMSMTFDRLEREVRKVMLPQMLKQLMQHCYPSKGAHRG